MNNFEFINKINKDIAPIDCLASVEQKKQIYYLVITTSEKFKGIDWYHNGMSRMFDVIVRQHTTYQSKTQKDGMISYKLGTLFDFLKEA